MTSIGHKWLILDTIHIRIILVRLFREYKTYMDKPFLEHYDGQTIQQLIGMKEDYRIDSLVLRIEDALLNKPEIELSEVERVVIAIEALEREVNNGGYKLFFTNSSCEYTPFIVRYLELIGCPGVAAISSDAVAALALPERYDANNVKQIASELSDIGIDKLEECDSRYFNRDEDIEQHLFTYIERHQNEIRIPRVA